jgi:predicted RNA-binding protein Jag
MKSDERRVVHELISDIPDITSATEGVEPRKRIVLLPTPASDEEEEE